MDESIQKHLEAPQVGVLKLSEAIRIGAKLRHQCTGTFFERGGSCALGAAMEGIGIPYAEVRLGDKEPIPARAVAAFPQLFPSTHQFSSLAVAIYKLNDSLDDRRTREEIADWLELLGY